MAEETLFTLEQYQAVKAAFAEGAKVVRYQDKWIEYRSLDEMSRILRKMEKELGINTNKCARVYASFSNGN